MGMIYRAFKSDDFTESSMALAETLANMPTRGLAYTKQALNEGLGHSLEAQLALEERLQIAAAQTADHAEGVAAFLGKRVPVFTGK
jgi:2-(1,2-epoxy-1,2-dihydrophenyl)acetyl-CoA isomerase